MAVTAQQFLAEFPEFREAPPEVVAAKLAEAARNVDVAIAGAKADDLIKYWTAELLAKSPSAEFARLKNKDGGTIYTGRLQELIRVVSYGCRVV